MTVLAFASVKRSPGVTTAVTALGHVWPSSREVLIAECDPAGGDLMERLDLDPSIGIVPLAADAADGLSAGALWSQVQRVGDLAVLAASPAGPPVREALLAMGTGIAEVLGGLKADVLIDCGRLWPGSPSLPLARAAELVVMVTRATDEEVPRIPYAVADLGVGGCVVLLLVGEREIGKPYQARGAVEETTGMEVVAVLPDDPRGARALAKGGRSRLVGEARHAVGPLLAAAGASSPSTTDASELAG